MKRLRPQLTYANVMATIAVFIALGGVSYAALKLPKNSVGTKQIKNGAVTPPKVSPATVTMFKGAKGDTGPQGLPGSDTVATEIVEKSTSFDTESPKELAVECPNGPALGGGYVLAGSGGANQDKLRAVRSYALPGDRVWLVRAFSDEATVSWQLNAMAVCKK
jgi:hypothetical protein